MKTTLLSLAAVLAIGGLYVGRIEIPRAHARGLTEGIAKSAAEIASLREESRHWEEQAAKAAADTRDALASLTAAKTDLTQAQIELDTLRAKVAALEAAAREAAKVPAVPAVNPAPSGPAPDQTRERQRIEARLAEIAARRGANTAALAKLEANRKSWVELKPDFTERNPLTGKGIRTSDADREKWLANQRAQIAAIDQAIARITKDNADQDRFEAEARAELAKLTQP